MMRQSFLRAAQPVIRNQQRFVSISAVRMADGDTGSPRYGGGQSQGDAFTQREAASEGLYVREREKEKLLELRKKIVEQKKHLTELEKHLDEVAKSSGGEQN